MIYQEISWYNRMYPCWILLGWFRMIILIILKNLEIPRSDIVPTLSVQGDGSCHQPFYSKLYFPSQHLEKNHVNASYSGSVWEAELRFTSADLSRFFLLRNVSGSVFFSPASGGFHNGGEELLELTKKPVGFPGIWNYRGLSGHGKIPWDV